MNSDFRVSIGLTDHPKTIKLMRRCGDRAFYSLIKFWSFVAQNRPDGVLHRMEYEDIEIAAGWDISICECCEHAKVFDEQCSGYADALLDLGFIEKIDNVICVHDWRDHNGYASHAKERSEKAKRAAEARWNRKNKPEEKQGVNAPSIPQALPTASVSNAPSPDPSPDPSPSPSPDPSPDPSPVLRETNPIYLKFSNQFLISQKARFPKPVTITEKKIKAGAVELGKLIRIDLFDLEYIREVLTWGTQDDFWSDKLLSLATLRKKGKNGEMKFSNLAAAYEGSKGCGGNGKRKLTFREQNNLAACQEMKEMLNARK